MAKDDEKFSGDNLEEFLRRTGILIDVPAQARVMTPAEAFEIDLDAELKCWVRHINTAIAGVRELAPMKKQPGIGAVPDLPPNIVDEIKTLILKSGSGLILQEQAKLASHIITLVKFAMAVPREWERRDGERVDNERAEVARKGRARKTSLLQQLVEKFGRAEFAKHPGRTANAIGAAIYNDVVNAIIEYDQDKRIPKADAIRKRLERLLPAWKSEQSSS